MSLLKTVCGTKLLPGSTLDVPNLQGQSKFTINNHLISELRYCGNHGVRLLFSYTHGRGERLGEVDGCSRGDQQCYNQGVDDDAYCPQTTTLLLGTLSLPLLVTMFF